MSAPDDMPGAGDRCPRTGREYETTSGETRLSQSARFIREAIAKGDILWPLNSGKREIYQPLPVLVPITPRSN
jgi:hypothetical protein